MRNRAELNYRVGMGDLDKLRRDEALANHSFTILKEEVVRSGNLSLQEAIDLKKRYLKAWQTLCRCKNKLQKEEKDASEA